MTSFASLETPRSLWSRAPSTARRASAASTVATSYESINSAPSETLIQLVAQGNVLLADLLRLSAQLPLSLHDRQSRFAAVLPDFGYLKDTAAAEQLIEASPSLIALDDEFREMHMSLIESLYRLYERILSYHKELTGWLTQLRSGAYIHASVESMLLGQEGRQLMVEAPSLLAAIMLLLDRRIPGLARERSVVAYFRARGGAQAVGPTINEVIALCASTGFSLSDKWLPIGYPETYLARLPLPAGVINALLGRLRSDDIYSQIVHYPSPQHRSAALAQQAGQLYLLLFYAPAVLQNDSAMMRVLVDKHYVDSWVVNWAPGVSADLAWEWANYKAAKTVLGGVATPASATQLAAGYAAALPEMSRQLGTFLVDGLVLEDVVLKDIDAILDVLRSCNVAARWLMLHSRARHPRLAPAIAAAAPPPEAIVSLVMEASLLEFEVKRVYTALLDTREERWAQARSAVVDVLSELSQFYAGDGVMARRLADDSLAQWLAHLADQVEHLVLDSDSGRRVRAIAAALDESEGHHAIEGSALARQHLDAARGSLATMIHIDHVREEVLGTLGAVSDFSFAWGHLEPYTSALQSQVRSDPAAVMKLRCFFLKLRSGLELPLLRVLQIGDAAATSLTDYYSSALLAYVRKVLQVVPLTVLELVDSVAEVSASGLHPPTARLAVADLRSHAQLRARSKFAALTRRIAALAQGVIAMERAFVGVIEVDPMQLLEDGLRAGIRQRIAVTLATCNTWAPGWLQPLAATSGGDGSRSVTQPLWKLFGGSASDTAPNRQGLHAALSRLAAQLGGFRGALESSQDYIAVRGLRLWHQEYAAVIRREFSRELQNSFPGSESTAQGGFGDDEAQVQVQPETIVKPAKLRPPVTCLGCLSAHLLGLTDVHQPTKAPAGSQPQLPDDVMQAATIKLVCRAVGPVGTAVIAQLLGRRIQQVLKQLIADVRRDVSLPAVSDSLQEAERALQPGEATAALPGSSPLPAPQDLSSGKARALLRAVETAILAVGQTALLRDQLALELRVLYEQEAGDAAGALAALSAVVAEDAKAALQEANPLVPPRLLEGDLLPRLTAMLDAAGLGHPNLKLYVSCAAEPAHMSLLLFLAMAAQLSGWQTDSLTGTLERSTTHGNADAGAFMAGLAVVLLQLPASCWQGFLTRCGVALRSHIAAATGSAAAGLLAAGVDVGLPPEVPKLVAVLIALEARGGVPAGCLPYYVPGIVLEAYQLADLQI